MRCRSSPKRFVEIDDEDVRSLEIGYVQDVISEGESVRG
jgi:hypothetical protein